MIEVRIESCGVKYRYRCSEPGERPDWGFYEKLVMANNKNEWNWVGVSDEEWKLAQDRKYIP